jgi:hypothetical protein
MISISVIIAKHDSKNTNELINNLVSEECDEIIVVESSNDSKAINDVDFVEKANVKKALHKNKLEIIINLISKYQ